MEQEEKLLLTSEEAAAMLRKSAMAFQTVCAAERRPGPVGFRHGAFRWGGVITVEGPMSNWSHSSAMQ